MDIESFRLYCMSKPGVTEGFPFGENVMVLKVMEKMFALADVDAFESINLKCDPELAVQLREEGTILRRRRIQSLYQATGLFLLE